MKIETSASRNYLLLLIILILSGITILVFTALYIQPIDGNLTRMGGYSERDFGWTSPQKFLANPSLNHKSYDQYYDIVVYGDSFSKAELWQSFISEKTGLTFLTLYWDETPLEDILNNPIFKSKPPRIFIFETGEGAFQNRLLITNFVCNKTEIEKSKLYWKVKYTEKTIPFLEKTRNIDLPFSDINFKYAFIYLKNTFMRYLFSDDYSKVKSFLLTRDDLFSNKKSDHILLLRTWFDGKLWNSSYLDKTLCSALSLQNSIQSNGNTLFMLMSIPDKSSAYRQYIANPDSHDYENIVQNMVEKNINIPRLDILLNNAITVGEKDVYLPNDTHFGIRGYELAAKSVLDFLRDIGVKDNTSKKREGE